MMRIDLNERYVSRDIAEKLSEIGFEKDENGEIVIPTLTVAHRFLKEYKDIFISVCLNTMEDIPEFDYRIMDLCDCSYISDISESYDDDEDCLEAGIRAYLFGTYTLDTTTRYNPCVFVKEVVHTYKIEPNDEELNNANVINAHAVLYGLSGEGTAN